MHVSVERLRIWLLAGAALLVLVVAGFLGLARWRAHRFLTELPKKLGADIRQETNAFTWSQTVKGRTVFTLHAAKAIQHKDGKYTLHDVGIAVYGHGEAQAEQPAGQKQNERVDRIYGKEFELDQAAGVVKAVGEVHLDLEAPAAKDAAGKMDYAAGADLKAKEPSPNSAGVATQAGGIHEVGHGDNRLIHVKTSNLVYLRKLGVAATDEEIEFEYNGLTGHAKGAEYNSDTGMLTLQQAVKVSGLEHGKPILLTASKAELDRTSHKATLADAKYVTVSGSEDSSKGRQQVQARHAVVLMRADGGVDRIDGDGAVTITAGDDMSVTGDRGEAVLNDTGRPVSAHITGNVKYAADDETRHARGGSSEARVFFDKQGRAERVLLAGGVKLNEQVSAEGAKVDGKRGGSDRELTADSVNLGLSTDAAGRSLPREVKATGSAKSSSMSADVLTARFVRGAAGGSRLDEVNGTGRPVLEQVSETGVVETSTGDALTVRFRDAAKDSKRKGSPLDGGSSDLATAVQQGHVVVTRKSPAKGGAPGEMDRATADRAGYDGDAQALALSGQVQLTNEDGVLWAERVVVEQKSGDASASGGVKASYKQASQGAAVHVLADRAELKKSSDTAVFHGSSRGAARLWQGSSQVEAPVLEFHQKQRRLVARGEGAGAAMAVRTVLVSTRDAQEQAGEMKTKEIARRAGVVRVTSREMTYTDASREAEFTGGVRVDSADGVMRGDRAAAFLEAAGAKKPAGKEAEAGLLGGSVERVVVSGGLEIDQPGRRATGDRLVYTASDGLFVLTGTSGVPPKVVDQARGVVTGEELRFRAADESIVISNGERNGSGPRVHTETRVKRDR
jgi:lipopolysaccharide export system protein LptA